VVISVIVILAALLVPAVQKIRQSANRTACANNLQQIGMAAHAHEDKLGVLADAGRYWTDPRSHKANGLPQVTPNQDWGFFYQILPYLGYPNEWSAAELTSAGAVIPLYFCPTRRSPRAYPGYPHGIIPANHPRGGIDYAGSGGTDMPMFTAGSPDFAGRKNGLVIPRKNADHVSLTRVPDGKSNTLLVSERNYNMKHLHNYTLADENNGYFDGWDWDTIRWGYSPPKPDRFDDSSSSFDFGASHHGGLNCLFGDGSVRFLLYGIDATTFKRLCDRSDGQAISKDIWK
jgi:type II secretory pathway pseudopilin PulG